MRATLSALLLLAFTAPAFAAADPNDAEGAKDHPDIPRLPGYYLSEQEAHDFNAFEFRIDDDGNTKSVEGRYWRNRYDLNEGKKRTSPLTVFRNYENAFKKKGGKTVWHDFPSGAMATLRMSLGKSERWMLVEAYTDDSYTLTIVEKAAMEQQIELSATEMMEQLDKNGFVSLYGIQFDTGKAAIKPESEPLLGEIVSLLRENASLKLSVDGHTDNVGNKKANQALSKQRAEAVKKWLVAKGVSASRLSAAGFGDAHPIADNRLEEGRAKNRRVELVKKK